MMKTPTRARSIQEQNDRALFRGARPSSTLYHFLLRSSWTQVLLAYIALYFVANVAFACGYFLTGGVANARPGSFADAFWFSVQILGTGGDGAMSSAGTGAHILVALESMLGILLIAMAGGLTFAKFSVPKVRVRFSAPAVVFVFDGVPTLAFKITNQRRELVAGVEVTLTAERPEQSAEGHEFWRSYDLKLRRSRIPALTRGFTVMHALDGDSPLRGFTPETFAAAKWDLEAALLGTDSISGQVVHASHTWDARDLRWGHRLADTFILNEAGRTILDLRDFDSTVPCEPTPGFPYPHALGEQRTK
ncbi:MAG TPA: hypothetical protein VH083_16740 [Myxococcales bacterium]|nr:hypothetical protein [Myxococcales bacterium]